MRYQDGREVKIGDIVDVPIPDGKARARIVMLGETYEHGDIDFEFLSWVRRERNLNEDSIVVEWLESNPFHHEDPNYAPVGNYMFTPLDEWIEVVSE